MLTLTSLSLIEILKKSSSMSSQPEGNQFKRKAQEGKVDREIEDFFKIGKKKENETSPEIALLVESVIAELDVAAEEDAELNRRDKPAITKLRKLSLLTDIIPRKHLQQEFIDRGVLSSLRKWLEPLPNGSIPNINVRAAVFECLNNLAIPLEHYHQREFLSKSGIGRAVMFYYKYDEETAANRRLAKELVDKWSRAIFNISTTFEDMKNYEEKTTFSPVTKATRNAAARAPLNDGLPELTLGRETGSSSSNKHVSRPEPVSMNFEVRPQSKVDPEAVRARAKRMAQGQPHAKLTKKLQELSARRRKSNVGARNVVKYL